VVRRRQLLYATLSLSAIAAVLGATVVVLDMVR
jgi:hypothetical protein